MVPLNLTEETGFGCAYCGGGRVEQLERKRRTAANCPVYYDNKTARFTKLTRSLNSLSNTFNPPFLVLPHNLPRCFVFSQPGELRMPQVTVWRPLCELDLKRRRQLSKMMRRTTLRKQTNDLPHHSTATIIMSLGRGHAPPRHY